MTIRETIHYIKSALQPLYDECEAASIARLIVLNRLGIEFSQLVLRYDEECRIFDIETMVSQLQQGRPVQYVLGEEEFCDLTFKVREGVLIPRPETEALVEDIVRTTKPHSRILDIGTGSGAIAISLAHKILGAEVVAVDISREALAVAKENAERLGVAVQFVEADALGDLTALGTFDVIVSNPPYIPQSDIATMHRNVVDFEPHLALFVPDDDALCFYRSIARNAYRMLREGGSLWFEIYEAFGEEVCAELRDAGFTRYEIQIDPNLKPRIAWATR